MLLFLILSTVGFSTTTIASRIYIDSIRTIAIFITPLLIAILLLAQPAIIGKFSLASLLYAFFLTYGSALAVLNEGFEHVSGDIMRNVVVTLVVIFIFSTWNTRIFTEKIVMRFMIYVIFTFLVTVYLGGFVFSYPFKFMFDYSTEQTGQQILYSQGISKFYGLGAVAATFLALNKQSIFGGSTLWLLALFLLVLSLLGGGRGDAAISLIICFVYAAVKMPGKITATLLIVVIVITNISGRIDLGDFTIFNRFLVVHEGNYGGRDELFLNALQLMISEPQCLLIGCGFGYFQSYYHLPSGMYPHNIYIESLIVWGIPLNLALLTLTVIGLKNFLKQSKSADALLIFLLFFSLIDSKSGTVLGSWMTFGGVVAFSARAISSLIHNQTIIKKQRFMEDVQ
ncbi:MAG: hypothetical protein Q8Q26_04005 [Pseudorhodobacter sp.]|nr:hypothetical protein [Pseudorhodobacter sp.]